MAGKQPIITAEDLKEVLECPVCLRVPRSAPIFQCVRGHIVCNECHAKLETCPVCRVPLGSTRSLISEKVLSRLPSMCIFSDHGCTIELLKPDLDNHEKECLYRLVRCVDLACGEKIPFAGLLDHMANDHEREDFVNAEGSTYRSHFIVHEADFNREIMWISDHLVLDGRHFFRECCRNANGLWFIWVYLLGTVKEADTYVYSIKITSEDKEEELAYRGKVLSLDVPKEKMSSIGSGLVFPDATARHFWTNLKIHYSVAVISKKSVKKKSSEAAGGSSSSSLKTSESTLSLKQSSSSSIKKEKSTSTLSEAGKSKEAVVATPTQQPLSSTTTASTAASNSAAGATAKPDTSSPSSSSATPEEVKETPC